MYWTIELIGHLAEAPFPCTKNDLIEYAQRNGLPDEVIENLEGLETGEMYHGLDDIWPDRPEEGEYAFDDEE